MDFLQDIHLGAGDIRGGAGGFGKLGDFPGGGPDQGRAFIQVLVAQV